MKKLALSITIAILALSSSASFAAGGRTVVGTFSAVFASNNGDAFVRFSSAQLTNGTTCSANLRYKINGADAGAKGLLAAALTAKVSGANVQMDIVECNAVDKEIINIIVL